MLVRNCMRAPMQFAARQGMQQTSRTIAPVMAYKSMEQYNKLNKQGLRHGTGAIGSGLAVVGFAGGGAQGMGTLFAGLVVGIARNPSMKDELFTNTMIGLAFVELFGMLGLAFAALLYASD